VSLLHGVSANCDDSRTSLNVSSVPAPDLIAPLGAISTNTPAVFVSQHITAAPTPLQAGIDKPNVFTIDGTIQYGLLSVSGEPDDLSSALSNPNWKNAIDYEYSTLIHNNTCHLVSLAPGQNLIDYKWVYKIK
jgi:hypothetical protein